MGRARAFAASILVVLVVSILLTGLDYYFMQLDGLPYREARTPTYWIFYGDQLLLVFPIIAIVSLEMAITDLLRGAGWGLVRQEFALGIADFFLGVMVEDSLWYAFRVFAPLKTDPLAGSWIRPAEPTATLLGYASIGGVIVPLWYFVLIPPVVAIMVALLVLSPAEARDRSPSVD